MNDTYFISDLYSEQKNVTSQTEQMNDSIRKEKLGNLQLLMFLYNNAKYHPLFSRAGDSSERKDFAIRTNLRSTQQVDRSFLSSNVLDLLTGGKESNDFFLENEFSIITVAPMILKNLFIETDFENKNKQLAELLGTNNYETPLAGITLRKVSIVGQGLFYVHIRRKIVKSLSYWVIKEITQELITSAKKIQATLKNIHHLSLCAPRRTLSFRFRFNSIERPESSLHRFRQVFEELFGHMFHVIQMDLELLLSTIKVMQKELSDGFQARMIIESASGSTNIRDLDAEVEQFIHFMNVHKRISKDGFELISQSEDFYSQNNTRNPSPDDINRTSLSIQSKPHGNSILVRFDGVIRSLYDPRVINIIQKVCPMLSHHTSKIFISQYETGDDILVNEDRETKDLINKITMLRDNVENEKSKLLRLDHDMMNGRISKEEHAVLRFDSLKHSQKIQKELDAAELKYKNVKTRVKPDENVLISTSNKNVEKDVVAIKKKSTSQSGKNVSNRVDRSSKLEFVGEK